MPYIVPTPTVNIIVPSPQRAGQSLTLYCNGITVRGITSRVYIVWRRGNTTVKTIHVTATSVMGNLLVYRDSYTIRQLSTSDDGAVYECRLTIQTSSGVTAHEIVRLNVTSEYTNYDYINGFSMFKNSYISLSMVVLNSMEHKWLLDFSHF